VDLDFVWQGYLGGDGGAVIGEPLGTLTGRVHHPSCGPSSFLGTPLSTNIRPLDTPGMIQADSMVRFGKMPEWVAQLHDESGRVFEFCLGRAYRINEIDSQGLFVLDVSDADLDHRFAGARPLNDIFSTSIL
jgi:hypothetical protein